MTPARSAVWGAVAAVFFLLPSPLTIEASDVYGGFALHLKVALALAVGGGLWGAARARFRAVDPADRVPRPLLALGVATTLLALAASAASGFGERLAVELLDDGGYEVAAQRGMILRATAIAVLLRLAVVREEGPLALGAASVLVGTLAAGALLAGAVGPTGLPPSFGIAAQVIAAAAIGAPLLGPRLPLAVGVSSIAAAAAVVGCLAAMLPSGAPPESGELLPAAIAASEAAHRTLAVKGLILGALLGGAAGVCLCRIRVPLREAFGRPLSVVGHSVLFVLLVPAGSLLHDLATIGATLWAFPTGLIPQAQLATAPEPAEIGLIIAVVVGGLIAHTGLQVQRWLGGVGLVWALATAGHALALQNPEWGRATWILPSSACFLLALVWAPLLRADTEGRDLGRHLRWGFVVAGAAAGPPALRFAAASLLTWSPDPAWVLGGGALVGIAVGFGAARLEPRIQLSLDERIGVLVLTGVGVLLPFYIAVFVGLAPATAAAAAVAAAVAGAFAARRELGGGPAWVWLLTVPWLLFYVSFGAVTDYRRGPSEAACRSVIERTDARVLVDRYALTDDQRAALPYDVLPLSDPDVVLASFKRIQSGTGGFLLTLDRTDPERRHLLRTLREDGPLWPERIVHEPVTGTTLVQILGVGAYAMWELEVNAGPETAAGRVVPLEWEPSNPGIDSTRGRAVLSYVPNRGGSNPLIDAIDLHEMQIAEHHSSNPDAVQMSDWATVDPVSGSYWVAALQGPLSFMITEIDGDSMQPTRRLDTYFPTVGMEIDRKQRRILATNVVGGDLAAIDLDTLAIRQTIPAGAFPLDVAIDRERGRLYVAGYGDGFVHRFSLGPEITALGKVEVGPLLRGVGIDPVSGRVAAASGCGIFELPAL